jgi:hypothetical protein
MTSIATHSRILRASKRKKEAKHAYFKRKRGAFKGLYKEATSMAKV